MWKNKYLILAIIPLFAAGFFITILVKTNPVRIQEAIVKAAPLYGPRKISVVTAPVVQEEQAQPQPQPQQSQPVQKPAPKPVAKVASKPAPTKTTTHVQSSSTTTAPAPRLSSSCSGGFTTQFICLLNNYRSSKGLRPMSYSSSLSAVALAHSTWMNTTGIFSHQESDGSHMSDRCAAAGITCHAENLAEGASSPQQLLSMWQNSSGHNAILLGPYSLIGIGIAGPYITADFE